MLTISLFLLAANVLVVFPSCFSGDIVVEQTIPGNNSLVCPGNVLQYTCSSGEGSLGWLVGSDQILYLDNSLLDDVFDVGGFDAILTSVEGQNFGSTLTNPMITLADNETKIQCVGGSSSVPIDVAVAGLFIPLMCSLSILLTCLSYVSGFEKRGHFALECVCQYSPK